MASLASVGKKKTEDSTPNILRAIADAHAAATKLKDLGVLKGGGSAYDPEKEFNNTLSMLGIGQQESAPDTAHIGEVIAQLRQMGGAGMAAVPGMGAAAGIVAGDDYEREAMEAGPGPAESAIPIESQAGTGGIAGGMTGVTPGSQSGAPPAQMQGRQVPLAGLGGVNPGFVQEVVQSLRAPEANPPTIQGGINAAVNQAVPPLEVPDFSQPVAGAPDAPETVPTPLRGAWQNIYDRWTKLAEGEGALAQQVKDALADEFSFVDPKTGERMAYKPPTSFGLEKVIGGKSTAVDIATLLVGLIAAASGEQGARFAAGLFQGALGGKMERVGRLNEEAAQKFAYEQNARSAKAASLMKQLGFTESQLGQLGTQMDRLASQISNDELKRIGLAQDKQRGKEIDQSKAAAVFERLSKATTASLPALISARDKWDSLDPGFAPTKEEVEAAYATGPAMDIAHKRLLASYAAAVKSSGGQFTVTERQEKMLRDKREQELKRLGIDPNSELAAILPEPPQSVETVVNQKFTFLKGKDRQQLAQGWRRLKQQQEAIDNARSLGDERNAIARFNAEVTSQTKYADAAFKAINEDLENKRKAMSSFNATDADRADYDVAKINFDLMRDARANPTFVDNSGTEKANPLYRPEPKALPAKTAKLSAADYRTRVGDVQRALDAGQITEAEAQQLRATLNKQRRG